MPVKLLIDSCFSRRFAAEIRASGYDVVWTGDWGPDPGDEAILARAFAEKRVLVTRDHDFAALAIVLKHRHAGILRIVDTPATASVEITLKALRSHEDDLVGGAIVVAFLHTSRVHRG